MSDPEQRQHAFWQAVRRGELPRSAWLVSRFGVSVATAKRDILSLRDRGAPLRFDGAVGGYCTDDSSWGDAGQLLKLDGLGDVGQIGGAAARGLLQAWNPELAGWIQGAESSDFDAAVLVTTSRGAQIDVEQLRLLMQAIKARRRVALAYRSPWLASGDVGDVGDVDALERREVSPWLVHIDDGHAYLRGFCHARQGLRAFHLGGLAEVKVLAVAARARPRDLRQRALARLGVGGDVLVGKVAVVRLRGAWARWVARERWHVEQRDRWEGEVLVRRFGYGLEIEVVRRLLAGGADVEVVSPLALRVAWVAEVRRLVAGLQGNDEKST